MRTVRRRVGLRRAYDDGHLCRLELGVTTGVNRRNDGHIVVRRACPVDVNNMAFIHYAASYKKETRRIFF